MQDILSADEIKQRCQAIRLNPEELGRRAKVAPSTVHRLGKSDNKVSTRWKLTRALVDEERRVLGQLLSIHGCRLVDGALPPLGKVPA